jgi:ectoine hydroxylase-related dioxygenase (phytanoyl-CoA dioxygenase family)
MNDPVNEFFLSDNQIDTYNNEGYLVIENVVKDDFILKIKKDILQIINKVGLVDNCALRQTREYVSNTALAGFIESENLRKLAGALMGGKANLYLPFTAVKAAHAGEKFNFHQDNNYTPHKGPSINLWCAFVDMVIENGCLYIDPKTHLKGFLEAETLSDGHRKVINTQDPQPMIIKAGSCVAFDRFTVHGSGENITSEHRVAYAMQYCREDTQYLLNEQWHLLSEKPRWEISSVESLEEIS